MQTSKNYIFKAVLAKLNCHAHLISQYVLSIIVHKVTQKTQCSGISSLASSTVQQRFLSLYSLSGVPSSDLFLPARSFVAGRTVFEAAVLNFFMPDDALVAPWKDKITKTWHHVVLDEKLLTEGLVLVPVLVP